MPTLDFKGKAFVYAHHLTVPYRSLFVDEGKSLPPNGQKPTLDAWIAVPKSPRCKWLLG
jgi:adenine-specific DNA-methyltransferase